MLDKSQLLNYTQIMQNTTVKENYFIGLALSNSSNYDSSICVLDRFKKIILLDKFYFAADIDYFFETSPYIASSIVAVSIAYDNSMLDGKWRIHSKNYKALFDNFKINRDNWTNRISKRCSDTISKLKEKNIRVLRCDTNQLRMAYGLCSHYLAGTSVDCKNFQTSMKIKYGFSQMPDNMLPASSLEAVLVSMFAYDVAGGVETKEIFDIDGVPVLSKKVEN